MPSAAADCPANSTRRLFDVYFAVDWSAKSSPSTVAPQADAIWVGELATTNDATPETRYLRTRAEARAHLRERLLAQAALGRRVFAGFDFAFGYPAGFASALGLDADLPPWRATWNELSSLIEDGDRNRNNRFAVASALNARISEGALGPFWGCSPRQVTQNLGSYGVSYPYPSDGGILLPRLRLTEQRLSGVQPTWKLLGVGSVGGQALLGIPVVNALRSDPALADLSRVWPFETGYTATPISLCGPGIVFAEIWPGVVTRPLSPPLPIRDQTQVKDVVEWLATLDESGLLGRLFAGPTLDTAGAASSTLDEEGWILGGP